MKIVERKEQYVEMVNSSAASRVIKAPVSVVQGIIADVSNYPAWVPDMRNVVLLDDLTPPESVRITVEAAWIKETYELSYHWSTDGVTWELVSSQLQKSQNGSITFHAVDAGCRVDYAIAIELKVPLIPVLRRKMQEHVINMALDSLTIASESAAKTN